MQVLYEEEGEFKVGAVLSRAPASLQVESPHGRRSKVKLANVLLDFDSPSGAELLAGAAKYAETLDTEFLWQCCGGGEFGFRDLAREYVGRDPGPVEAAGVLLKLHAAPMHFHRRGRGRYQAAPEETLRLALASAEKKQRVQQQINDWSQALARFERPPAIEALRDDLLYRPDRNRPETKALEAACRASGLAPAKLLERCGMLPDSHAFHLNRFLYEAFAGGRGFAPHDAPAPCGELPLAPARTFSLDDSATTEIDDAFSIERVADDEWRIGVHIAAPALGFAPGSSLDLIARERLCTAYMPGRKFTMLPDDAIAGLSLDEGTVRPAVSLYLRVGAADFAVRGSESRLERIAVARNLRHGACDMLNAGFESGATLGLEFEDELRTLWKFAQALEAKRGKPSVNLSALDYNFSVDDGRIRIDQRRRGAPLDKLVSELMILANATWGELLGARDVAAIYRVQSSGKVRMSVHPEPHEGLGLACYAWMSSPLRRYIDLVNQWQLVAALEGRGAPLARNSEQLLSAMRGFEVAHARCDEHQRAMETYWCLRWLLQEGVTSMEATVLRDGTVRLDRLPLVARVPSLPEIEQGRRVRVEIGDVDLIACSFRCAFLEVLEPGSAAAADSRQG